MSRQAAIRVTQAELKDYEQQLRSVEKLAEQDMISRMKLEEARTAAEVARTKVIQAEAQQRH